MKKFVSKIAHSGFYIILFLCMCAIGISGYVMYLAQNTSDAVTDATDAAGSAELPFPVEQETLYDFGTATEIEPPEEEPEPEKAPEPEPEKKAEPSPGVKKNESSAAAKTESAVPTVSVPEEKTAETVYTMAVNGAITEPFSGEELVKSDTLGDWRIHAGVDIAGALGGDVKAIADGKIKSVTTDSMMGNTITVEHASGLVSVYANLADGIAFKSGDPVKSGDVIAKIGQTALAECMEEPHLHLEVTKDGRAIDPLSLYPSGEE